MSKSFDKIFQWSVIGSGPAGIAAIGELLDRGILGEDILWLDPKFEVGDFGALWKSVSSNTPACLFFDYFNACDSFEFHRAPKFEINDLDPKDTCLLKYAVEPLHWITQRLMQKINAHKDFAEKVYMKEGHWIIETKAKEALHAKNIILAIGSEPRSLKIKGVEEIPLELALDKEELKKAVKGKNKIAVFGSSHSAVLLLRDLLDLGVKEVHNFYRGALRYAVFLDDWVLFDNTGLKGRAAEWSRDNLHGKLPERLHRHLSNDENIEKYFHHCESVIYATGFESRKINIEGLKRDFNYNPHCGIIAPGLFGFGIAFPEKVIDRYGHQEYSVGLWKFIDYLKRVIPLWQQYGLD